MNTANENHHLDTILRISFSSHHPGTQVGATPRQPPTGHHPKDITNWTPSYGKPQADTILRNRQIDTIITTSSGPCPTESINWTPSLGKHHLDTILKKASLGHHPKESITWTPSQGTQLDTILGESPTGHRQTESSNWTPSQGKHQLDTHPKERVN